MEATLTPVCVNKNKSKLTIYHVNKQTGAFICAAVNNMTWVVPLLDYYA